MSTSARCSFLPVAGRAFRGSLRTIFLSFVVFASACIAGEPLIKDGEKLAFLGDSITQFGASSPGGYVRLVVEGLKANGINIKAIPAGISGHESDEMLARIQKDVIAKKPDWMTLSCGVNDVWHGCGVNGRGVSLEDYKKNIASIVDQCQAAGIKVMILTSTMIGENPKDARNVKLAPYNDFLRELAGERKLPLADLYKKMGKDVERVASTGVKGLTLTCDGVHMAPLGNQMMAAGIIETFGLDTEGVNKAREAWKKVPAYCWRIDIPRSVTMEQYQALLDLATKQGKPIKALLDEAYATGIKLLLDGTPSAE